MRYCEESVPPANIAKSASPANPMTPATAAILCNPRPSEHIVYSCTDDTELTDALTLFAKAGLMRGEAVILVVTAKHANLIRQRLEQEGY